MKPFTVSVPSLQVAKIILDTLGAYDQFQLENRIKPDYCNAGGLNVLEDGEWVTWYDEDTGVEIDELTVEQCVELDRKREGVVL